MTTPPPTPTSTPLTPPARAAPTRERVEPFEVDHAHVQEAARRPLLPAVEVLLALALLRRQRRPGRRIGLGALDGVDVRQSVQAVLFCVGVC